MGRSFVLLAGLIAVLLAALFSYGSVGDTPRVFVEEPPSEVGLQVSRVRCHDPRGLVCTSAALRSEDDDGLNIVSTRRKPLVVFLHGFPDTFRSFVPQMRSFSAAGFDVVAPQLLGYDPSRDGSRPLDFSLHSAALDVRAMLTGIFEESEKRESGSTAAPSEGPALEVHLVGHDWGSAVAQCVAAMLAPTTIGMRNTSVTRPRKILLKSVTLVSVPPLKDMTRSLVRNPGQLRHSWYMLFFQLPWVPEMWLRSRPPRRRPAALDASDPMQLSGAANLGGGITYLFNAWGKKPYPSHRLVDVHAALGGTAVRRERRVAFLGQPWSAVQWYRANVVPMLFPGWVVSVCEWLVGSSAPFAKSWDLINNGGAFSVRVTSNNATALSRTKKEKTTMKKKQKQKKKGGGGGIGRTGCKEPSWWRSVPVLLLVGADDGCITPTFFEAATAPYLDNRGVLVEKFLDPLVVDGAGHWIHWDAPESFNRLVLDFVSASSRSNTTQHAHQRENS